MTTTVMGLFSSVPSAVRAIDALTDDGFSRHDISMLVTDAAHGTALFEGIGALGEAAALDGERFGGVGTAPAPDAPAPGVALLGVKTADGTAEAWAVSQVLEDSGSVAVVRL